MRPIDEPRNGSFGLLGSPKTQAHFLSLNMWPKLIRQAAGIKRPPQKDTIVVVRTLLDDRVEQVLKGLCLRHNGTGAGTGIPAAATCLDGLLIAMERVGDCAFMLYRLGMRACFGESRYG
ncbi:hypothetical protein L3X38_005778 [Prunus dulcis]|uniref:Uncharacterized protein n=1 Tax=Prunus dulcis TaxID=3755 RepID=A0AAD4ZRI4_PRUDU|nr:hypothetical protein L3X38_005778 [Prunus dulcis]